MSNAQEKAHYLNHRNQAEDDGYRRFLARLFNPVNQQLKKRSAGLDFGCGPGPTLHLMFEDAGHKMAIYDSFFFPDKAVLEAQYDFITASEVVEHLHHPREVIEELWRCLRPGGMLAIMTQFVPAGTPFEKWYYKNDETHVCFFSPETFMYLETQLQARLTLHRNVAIYTRIKASIPKESI
ncbi:MAG: class I SAM-dependent methyltransferase [Deltaproteobacteria bacterium]|nr:class I SAM-dependent methyltransferase [Deltaproteobacteria bacterium]